MNRIRRARTIHSGFRPHRRDDAVQHVSPLHGRRASAALRSACCRRSRSGRLVEDHPLASEILPTIANRRALYVAVLLHDIAKGRRGSFGRGADSGAPLCPRFRLTEAETETVAWLVEQHLVMSNTAQSRDPSDRRTIGRSRTIRAARAAEDADRADGMPTFAPSGPVWNGWKGQLLRFPTGRPSPMLTGGIRPSTERRADEGKNSCATLAGLVPIRISTPMPNGTIRPIG